MGKYLDNLIAQGADPVLIAKLADSSPGDAAPVADDTANDEAPAPRKPSKPRKRAAKR